MLEFYIDIMSFFQFNNYGIILKIYLFVLFRIIIKLLQVSLAICFSENDISDWKLIACSSMFFKLVTSFNNSRIFLCLFERSYLFVAVDFFFFKFNCNKKKVYSSVHKTNTVGSKINGAGAIKLSVFLWFDC